MIKDVEAFASELELVAKKARAGEIIIHSWGQNADIYEWWGADGYKYVRPNNTHTVTFSYQIPAKEPLKPIEHLIERLKKELP